MNRSAIKYLTVFTAFVFLGLHCKAQDTINIKIKKANDTSLIGNWNFFLKSEGPQDTSYFETGYSFIFQSSGSYIHMEKGKIVENGTWKLIGNKFLLLYNRAYHVNANNNTLLLKDKEEIVFAEKNSFFIKIPANNRTHIIIFVR